MHKEQAAALELKEKELLESAAHTKELLQSKDVEIKNATEGASQLKMQLQVLYFND